MKPRHIVIPVVFIMFLLSGYIIMGYARHHTYEDLIQHYIAERIAFKEKGIENPMGWEDHEYLGTPEAALVIADPVFQEEIYYLWDEWLAYSTEYNTDVLLALLEDIDDDTWSLWDAYKKLTIYKYLRGTLNAVSNLALQMDCYNDSDRGGVLAESVALWEAAGGIREGNWIDIYKQSPEYRVWLDKIFDEISDSRGIPSEPFDPRTMEDLYLETKQHLEFTFSSFPLQKDMVETQQRMTEIAYERYIVHLPEKDIPRTDIDAWVIRFGSKDFHKTMTDSYRFPNVLSTGGFPQRDIVLDICIIVVFSTVSTFVVVKKVLARSEIESKN
jgi:hypothetical protein